VRRRFEELEELGRDAMKSLPVVPGGHDDADSDPEQEPLWM
jgi:hypothetical protein